MNKLIIRNIIQFKYIFNFAASFSGGGQKRLYEYTMWFNTNGGAFFIINYRCKNLIEEFPNNNYLIIKQNKIERIFFDQLYLNKIKKNDWILYFAYGIPVYKNIACINWFHINNILPFINYRLPIGIFLKTKMLILRYKILRNIQNADIISGESNYTISTIKKFINSTKRYYLLLNGCEKELITINNSTSEYNNHAIIVGTYKYKQLHIAYQIYKEIIKNTHINKLIILGKKKNIPLYISNDKSVVLMDFIPRNEVYTILAKSQYYISTTIVENSSNASLEGVLLAQKSIISDIEPHREMLEGCNYKIIRFDKLKEQFLYCESEEIKNIKIFLSWDEIIKKQICFINNFISRTIN